MIGRLHFENFGPQNVVCRGDSIGANMIGQWFSSDVQHETIMLERWSDTVANGSTDQISEHGGNSTYTYSDGERVLIVNQYSFPCAVLLSFKEYLSVCEKLIQALKEGKHRVAGTTFAQFEYEEEGLEALKRGYELGLLAVDPSDFLGPLTNSPPS